MIMRLPEEKRSDVLTSETERLSNDMIESAVETVSG